MKITGIRLENVRVFEDALVPIDAGLTVLIGRNNAGKSTVLRAPFMLRREPADTNLFRRAGVPVPDMSITLRFAADPKNLERELGFSPDVLTRYQAPNESGWPVGLHEHPSLRDWIGRPFVELGRSWPGLGGDIAIVRLASQSTLDCLEVRGGRKATVRVGTRRHEVELSGYNPFARALNLAPADQDSGVGGSLVAYWEHHRVNLATKWIVPPGRRLWDSREAQLQEVLTFLRMKHPDEFSRVSAALRHALPEFGGLDFIEQERTGFKYRPGFALGSGGDKPLARESIGSGAWAYLCILTAARAAKATGAKILFLDEPHLYMHPGLERMLLEELLDKEKWDGEPLQIVAATHSPTFVNYAVEHGTLNVLEWKDAERKSAKVHSIRSGGDEARGLSELVPEPGDLLYADAVVFVEGVSDVAALRILASKRCKLKTSIRYVPLRAPDAIAKNIRRFFSVVVEAGGIGTHTRAFLLLDGDKMAALVPDWDKLQMVRTGETVEEARKRGELDPRKTPGLEFRWANPKGNDLESLFCEEGFLVNYFADLEVPETKSRPAIKAIRLDYPAMPKSGKGSTAIARLHEDLLGESNGGRAKADYLEMLMRFYVKVADKDWASQVAEDMKPIEDALRALDRGATEKKPIVVAGQGR